MISFVQIHQSFYMNKLGHFTCGISLLLRLSLSPKSELRPKISQKVKSFFSFGLSNSLSV